jgi:alkanesulfonate monooxygenase SsuD/methylene tetrahydromethanopterin reductase-like flavin-dependent oxidoreductase (luciferase family)
VTTRRLVDFGYNPPTGNRLIETINPRTFVQDLQNVLDIACQHFSSIWVSDHHMTGDRFRLECWTQLTWIAARFPGPLLGTIVMANSYRHPPLLAKMAASLQVFSHGRFILGYGAGWAEDEYRAYGYEFPSARVRIAQMVEGIQVMRALWTQSPATFRGEYYQVTKAFCEPRPDPIPPIMIGGDGERYLLRAVAEHADWWLPFSRRLDQLSRKCDVLRQHCHDVGRDYDSIRKTYTMTVYLSKDRAAAERRAGAALERENPAFAGDPAALRDHLDRLVELGFDLFQLVFPNFPETDDIKLFVDEVLPHFR